MPGSPTLPVLHASSSEAALTHRSILCRAVLTLGPAIAYGYDRPAPPARVGVVLRNLSDVSAAVIQRAEADCARIFSAHGVEIAWMNTADPVDWRGPAIVLQVAIVPGSSDFRLMDVFGAALPFRKTGIQVFIYHERVVALSSLTQLPVHSALTAAFTHEIGHMLLRSTAHALMGIMQSDWGGRELRELSCNLLRFTPQERAQIRKNVLSAADESNHRSASNWN